MSIVANKFPGVRAAPCHDDLTAEMSRRHNDLNVLCLSGDIAQRAAAGPDRGDLAEDRVRRRTPRPPAAEDRRPRARNNGKSKPGV